MEYSTVTELAGDEISSVQLKNCIQRYYWAGNFCEGKDVLEVACGTGQGLGFLASHSKKILAGDFTLSNLEIAKSHYGNTIPLLQLNAQDLPFKDGSLDVILLLEAIYYLPEANKFLSESRRVLRKNGRVLIVTTNKDIFGFNPSSFSTTYYGISELKDLLLKNGFSCEFFGVDSENVSSFRKIIVRWVKYLAVTLNLIPKTMEGKKWLKKIIFGDLVKLPNEIKEGMSAFVEPSLLDDSKAETEHEILFCSALVNKND